MSASQQQPREDGYLYGYNPVNYARRRPHKARSVRVEPRRQPVQPPRQVQVQQRGNAIPPGGNHGRRDGGQGRGANNGGNGTKERAPCGFAAFGIKGFLFTTRLDEAACSKDAHNLLCDFQPDGEEERSRDREERNEPDGERAAAPGVPAPSAATPTTASKGNSMMMFNGLFSAISTGLPNVIFIGTTLDDPTELATRIYEAVLYEGKVVSQAIRRLIPIELTCFANDLEGLKPKLHKLFSKYLSSDHISYRIVFNSRRNEKLRRDNFIQTATEMVTKINPLCSVALVNADFTIVIEVLRELLCVGIVKDYDKFMQLNLMEVMQVAREEQRDPMPIVAVPVEPFVNGAGAQRGRLMSVEGNGGATLSLWSAEEADEDDVSSMSADESGDSHDSSMIMIEDGVATAPPEPPMFQENGTTAEVSCSIVEDGIVGVSEQLSVNRDADSKQKLVQEFMSAVQKLAHEFAEKVQKMDNGFVESTQEAE